MICSEYLRTDIYSAVSNDFGSSDRPYARFDSISGYKYIPGKSHLINIQDGQLAYDVVLNANGRGYPSIYEYPFLKTDSNKKRLMVLGDSYSSGEITDTTWVDLLNKKLADTPGNNTELFNFSLEAIGIRNWNNIFFKEIVPNYQFDGIVLAVFGDKNYYSSDLVRPFAIKNSDTKSTSQNFFESLPANKSTFDAKYKNELFEESAIYPAARQQHYAALALHHPDTQHRFEWILPKAYFLDLFTQAVGLGRKYYSFRARYAEKNADEAQKTARYDSWKDYEQYYGPEKTKLIKDILDYCVAHHKEIWLISIPSFGIASDDPKHYRDNIYNRQLRFLASQYGAHFYDGYEMLDQIAPKDYTDYHLYEDTHWNRKGINLFLSHLPLK